MHIFLFPVRSDWILPNSQEIPEKKQKQRNLMDRLIRYIRMIDTFKQMMQKCLFFLCFFICTAASGILVPQPGIKLVPPALKAGSLNHWATKMPF